MISGLFLLVENARPLGEALPELFGRLHPMSVHFPVALLLVAAFCEGLNLLRPTDNLRRGAYLCLVFGTLGAFMAAGTGWVHVELEGSRKEGVEWHRWLGVAAASTATLATILGFAARRATKGARSILGYRVALFLTAALVGATGKLGGEMSWGKDWYFEPFEARQAPRERVESLPDIVLNAGESSSSVDGSGAGAGSEGGAGEGAGEGASEGDGGSGASPATEATVSYRRTIEPILDARCYQCHGPSGKADADLRLSNLVEAQESYFGFDWEALIVPGSPDDSALLGVMLLPQDDSLAMPPPADAEPMTPEEIELVRRWIEGGATLDQMLAD